MDDGVPPEENGPLLESVLNSSLSGIMAFHACRDERGVIVDFAWRLVNEAATRLVGRTRAELLGRRLLTEMPGARIEGLFDLYTAVVETGVPLNHEHYYEHEHVSRWFHAVAVKLGDGFVVTFTDITAGKQAEAALRENETIFQHFLDYSPVYVFFKDAQIRSLRLSRNYETMIGRPLDELLGKSMNDLFPSDLAKRMVADDIRIMNEGREVTVDEELGGRSYQTTKFPIVIDGTPRYLAGFTVDVTERKRAEEERARLQDQVAQSQRLEAIGTLASGVAHEINNPLGIVMNFAQLILDEPDTSAVSRDCAAAIVRQSERMATIVRTLLAFARREREDHLPTDLGALVAGTLSLVHASLRKDQIKLSADLPDGLPRLRCRGQQIQQVLMNLLTNARDALNDRFPGSSPDKVIHITARPFERDGAPWIRLTVADRGVGMLADVAERAFDPFFTTKPKGEGTGLGLSISYGIVKEHAGVLWFESRPGEGTTFHVDLPTFPG